MKIAKVIASRREQWQKLEGLCVRLEAGERSRMSAEALVEFSALYRSACADLALADANLLPPNTVQYLHRLVGRAHNQLYRSKGFDFAVWYDLLMRQVPRRVFSDICVQFAFVLFWGVFIFSAILASSKTLWPNYAENALSEEQISNMESMFSDPPGGRSGSADVQMAAFYIQHNTSIGLWCFVGGLLVVPGVLITSSNAVYLGAAFGYMARPDVPEGANFFHFVTAHGPFELTAIVLSAGAGLRLGMSWMKTNGLTRSASLRKTAPETMPVMGAAMALFFLAALIEAFLSPSAAPYPLKAFVALISSGLLAFYFIVLGFPRGEVEDAVG